MANENALDGLQVEFGGHVHHGKIFVIEIAMLLRRVAVPLDKMIEHIEMRRNMTFKIHRHKAGQLQKARINLPAHREVGERHSVNAMTLEPLDAALLGQLVYLRGIDSRIDRPAHQNHGFWRVWAVFRIQQGNGADQRHRGLTDPERMQRNTVVVSREAAHHLRQIINVVVEIEASFGKGHVARVPPVGDVDVVMRQEGFHRAA